MMKQLKKMLKKGDTIIEVTLAISVFSLISVLSIQIMDRDLAMIQGTLESEMARNEIDAQAEALRFIQNAYLSERELGNKNKDKRYYQPLWLKLSRGANDVTLGAGAGLANDPAQISQYTSLNCADYYNLNSGAVHKMANDHAFIMNTRKINPSDVNSTIVQIDKIPNAFREAPLYPRVIYTKGSTGSISDATLSELAPGTAGYDTENAQNQSVYDRVSIAEGIWVISAKAKTKGSTKNPEFYDFHIRTCWFAPGHDQPSRIATTIRLYNPEYIEAQM